MWFSVSHLLLEWHLRYSISAWHVLFGPVFNFQFILIRNTCIFVYGAKLLILVINILLIPVNRAMGACLVERLLLKYLCVLSKLGCKKDCNTESICWMQSGLWLVSRYSLVYISKNYPKTMGALSLKLRSWNITYLSLLILYIFSQKLQLLI